MFELPEDLKAKYDALEPADKVWFTLHTNFEVQTKLGDRAKGLEKDNYGGLYTRVSALQIAYTDADEVHRAIDRHEEIYMELNHGDDPEAKHTKNQGRAKVGDWKVAEILGPAYMSAKSVLLAAVRKGIELPEERIGKSALEKKIKEKRKVPENDIAAIAKELKCVTDKVESLDSARTMDAEELVSLSIIKRHASYIVDLVKKWVLI